MLDVRALKPDDWQTTRGLRLAALLDAPEAFGGTYEESSQRDEASWRAWPQGGQAYAAWLDGEPVGLACWIPDGEAAGTSHLIAMWVAPRARGTGVAARLIDSVAQHAREQAHEALELVVYRTNPGARRAYTKNGFKEIGPSERWPDAILMRLALS